MAAATYSILIEEIGGYPEPSVRDMDSNWSPSTVMKSSRRLTHGSVSQWAVVPTGIRGLLAIRIRQANGCGAAETQVCE